MATYGLLPKIRIIDLLTEVAAWTGFSDCFTHLRSGLPFEDNRVILTTVLADATNLGLTGMAEACSVATYKQLVWTAGWHLREETYGRALARIVAAQQANPLAAAFGEASTSSSDGQHFPLGGRGESTGAVNPHKGSSPAISFYTHISGRYAPYHSKPISVADGEALHVLDGLLYRGADLNAAAQWPALEPFIAGRIDEALIRTHWDDILRLATSVRTSAVPASLMLRGLGSYPRRLMLTLWHPYD